MKRFKVAVIHPKLIVGGGSETCAVWIVEALKNDYDLSVITMDCADFGLLNKAYFSGLKEDEINLINITLPSWLKNGFDALRSSLLARFCRKKSPEFDLMISTYNVMDFGRKGIQRIADFSFDDKLRRKLDKKPKGIRGFLYLDSPFRRVYLGVCRIIAHTSSAGWRKNITIANSAWTAAIMKEVFGIETKMIYHAVPGEYPLVNWEDREDGFICMARLVPEKGIENVIQIVEKLRQRGHNLHLHILGRADDLHYTAYLRRLCAEKSSWLFMEGLVLGSEKIKIITQHKFGISGRKNEPFGIAVAEMVKAGSIVWVPDSGGQEEIVDHRDLVYSDIDDAVGKIERVLKDNALQVSLGEHLSRQAGKFSTDKFKQEFRDLVGQFFKGYETK